MLKLHYEQGKWLNVEDLGNHAFFIDLSSQDYISLCATSNEKDEDADDNRVVIKGNVIYMTAI